MALSDKPVQNATLGAGTLIAVAVPVLTHFHVLPPHYQVSAEDIVIASAALGVAGHAVTYVKEFVAAVKARNVAKTKADEAAAVAEMVRTLKAIEAAKAAAPNASVEALAAAAVAQLAEPPKPALPVV